jgi:hypothetical protein
MAGFDLRVRGGSIRARTATRDHAGYHLTTRQDSATSPISGNRCRDDGDLLMSDPVWIGVDWPTFEPGLPRFEITTADDYLGRMAR